jgi:hypothetical protein
MVHADAATLPAAALASPAAFYAHVGEQVAALCEGQRAWVCNLANASSVLYAALNEWKRSRGKRINWAGECAARRQEGEQRGARRVASGERQARGIAEREEAGWQRGGSVAARRGEGGIRRQVRLAMRRPSPSNVKPGTPSRATAASLAVVLLLRPASLWGAAH